MFQNVMPKKKEIAVVPDNRYSFKEHLKMVLYKVNKSMGFLCKPLPTKISTVHYIQRFCKSLLRTQLHYIWLSSK